MQVRSLPGIFPFSPESRTFPGVSVAAKRGLTGSPGASGSRRPALRVPQRCRSRSSVPREPIVHGGPVTDIDPRGQPAVDRHPGELRPPRGRGRFAGTGKLGPEPPFDEGAERLPQFRRPPRAARFNRRSHKACSRLRAMPGTHMRSPSPLTNRTEDAGQLRSLRAAVRSLPLLRMAPAAIAPHRGTASCALASTPSTTGRSFSAYTA